MNYVNKLSGDPHVSALLRALTGRNGQGGTRHGDRKPGVRRFWKRVANRKLRHQPLDQWSLR